MGIKPRSGFPAAMIEAGTPLPQKRKICRQAPAAFTQRVKNMRAAYIYMRECVLNVIIRIVIKFSFMRSNYVFGRRQTYNFALALPAAGMRQARVCYPIIHSPFLS